MHIVMAKAFFRLISQLVFGTRRYNNRCIKKFSKGIKNKKILELGSGKKLRGEYFYSTKRFFDKSNEFIQTDVNKKFGHKVLDVTKMDYRNKYDVIICMNVLEHVYDFNKAVSNIYKALKKKGTAVIFVPVFYPLHDEPGDYWRFTEHSLRKMLKDFSKVEIRHSGIRQYPFAYYIEAIK